MGTVCTLGADERRERLLKPGLHLGFVLDQQHLEECLVQQPPAVIVHSAVELVDHIKEIERRPEEAQDADKL